VIERRDGEDDGRISVRRMGYRNRISELSAWSVGIWDTKAAIKINLSIGLTFKDRLFQAQS
jgi:hypothetical protein